MVKLSLIIESPNAGNVGHHFLVSSSDLLESEVVQASASASRNAVGPTYISVSRKEVQTLNNQTVRDATERIILLSVVTQELNEQQIKELQAALTRLFSSLRSVLDAESSGLSERSTMSVCSEMETWLESEDFKGLPLVHANQPTVEHEENIKQATQSAQTSAPRSIFTFLLLGIGLAISGLLYIVLGGHKPYADAPPRNGSKTQSAGLLAREWGCSQEDLAAGLLRAANWDRRDQTISLEAAIRDAEVAQLVKNVEKSRPPEQFFVSPAVANETRFRQFAIQRGTSSPVEAIQFRTWLFTTWEEFLKFKYASQDASQALAGVDETNVYYQFMVHIANSGVDVGAGDGFEKPRTPLYDRQDVMIYAALDSVRVMMSETGLARILLEEDASQAEDLADLTEHLRASLVRIKETVKEDRRTTLDNKKLTIDHVKVREAYEKLESFLLRFSATEAF